MRIPSVLARNGLPQHWKKDLARIYERGLSRPLCADAIFATDDSERMKWLKDMNKSFDPFAMIHPKNDREISAMLDEALAELRSINGHLESLLEPDALISRTVPRRGITGQQ